MKILVTCPPMLGQKEEFVPILEGLGYEVHCPDVAQTLSEEKLIEILPSYDGWIIGDDPATERVFKAGAAGNLKAAIKWGIGTDNVDFEACQSLNIPISNTPNMFGPEVADLAIGYVIGLARQTFIIDREIREGLWPKRAGISLMGKKAGIVGFGDIGQSVVERAQALGLEIVVYDPSFSTIDKKGVHLEEWPKRLGELDFIIFTCSLNKKNIHMLNHEQIKVCKDAVRIVNVARGPLINEAALCEGLISGKVHSVALDVFEIEPLPKASIIREHPLCILGSHNASNTIDAVAKTNQVAIEKLLTSLSKAS